VIKLTINKDEVKEIMSEAIGCNHCGDEITRIGVKKDGLYYCNHHCLDNDVNDAVSHPKHYTSHPSGIECIQVTEHMNFNLGNAVKYLWRSGKKEKQIEDLKKAAWYINREIEKLEG
jgi:hypothetical protein